MVEISICADPAAFARARRLIEDYLAWLAVNLAFQGIDDELANLAGMFGAPTGVFVLACAAGRVLGGVGVRRLDRRTCEMKRLFVQPHCNGQGIGRQLCERAIREAHALGYQRMRLDTIARLAAANRLYERLGFRDIAPYCANPDPTARFMELDLGGARSG